MKKALITLALLLAFVSSGYGQGTGPITVKEADGSPSYTGIRTFIFDNGTVTISGNTVRVLNTGGGGSGTVTTFSCVNANGVSCSVANATSTPAATFTLGAITPTSVNGLTISTVTAGTLTLTNSKTFTVSNTLTLAGTDGSTLNVGAGGTLGTAAFTAASAYEVPLTFSTGLTRSTNTVTVNTTQNVAKLSNLTGNGFVKTSGGDGTLSVDTATYLTGLTNASTTIGSGNTTRFLYNNGGVLDQSGSGFTTDGTNVTATSGVFRATSPRLTTSIFDANGLPILRLSPTASATQSFSISNDVAAGTVSLVADVPAVATTTIAGTNVAITASAATVASTTPGAAAGGSVTITAGAAARLSSGDANGGNLNFVTGAGVGAGIAGSFTVTSAATTGTTTTSGSVFTCNSLTTGTCLYLGSTSTAGSSTTSALFDVSRSGAQSGTVTTTAGRFSNTSTGASATNTALALSASGATGANYALNVTAGDMWLNTGQRFFLSSAGTTTGNYLLAGNTINLVNNTVSQGGWNGSGFYARRLILDAANGDVSLERRAARVLGIAQGEISSTGPATISSGANTPAQITSDQNNYTPGVGLFQRWSSDAARTVTGLLAGATDGQLAVIWNVGAQNIILANESASSTAANRFTSASGADITLAGGNVAFATYSTATSRWLVVKF